MTSPNLSHFYISKKPLLVFQSSANLPNFRLPAPIGQNFERLVMVFLKYNNGSNLERSLLSIIQSFVANPSKMKIFLIMLVRSIIYFFLSFFSLIKRFYSKSWSANQNYVCILQICRLCGFSRVFFFGILQLRNMYDNFHRKIIY